MKPHLIKRFVIELSLIQDQSQLSSSIRLEMACINVKEGQIWFHFDRAESAKDSAINYRNKKRDPSSAAEL